MNKYSDEKMNEFRFTEENNRKSLEEKDTILKQKYHKKEEQLKTDLLNEVASFQNDIEKSKFEIEKIKRENKELQDKIDKLENLIANKENNYKKLREGNDKEFEKLLISYKELQNEKNNFEVKTNEKTNEKMIAFLSARVSSGVVADLFP